MRPDNFGGAFRRVLGLGPVRGHIAGLDLRDGKAPLQWESQNSARLRVGHVQGCKDIQRQPHWRSRRSESRDDAIRNPPHRMICAVGDIQRSVESHRQARGKGELRSGRRAAIATYPGAPVPATVARRPLADSWNKR